MKSNHLFVLFISILFSFSSPTSGDTHQLDSFLQCLQSGNNATSISNVVYTQSNSSYSSILDLSFRNFRYYASLEPLVIITPTHVSHVQAAINCSRDNGLQIRIRSGGHDYEGLSYVSPVPFVLIDLINLRSIDVDAENNTAWVQAGATIGELYYRIAEKTATLAFPAGSCPTVGVGGHFSGGGYGMLMRKFGLAADQIIDAQVVDINGKLLDKNSMGEDLFWAIRGGGAASFCVVVSWKVKLVPVPPTVTVFTVKKTLEENGTMLVHKWQSIAPKIHEDLYIRLFLNAVNSSKRQGKRTIQATFTSMYLGGMDELIELMQERFPELGLVQQDCIEMSWIQSILYFADIPQTQPLEILLNRTAGLSGFFKGKSDYVTKPIPEAALEGLWQRFYRDESQYFEILFSPYGGVMEEIPESETPYPHRAGYLFNIHYVVAWKKEDDAGSKTYINYMRRLYKYMEPHVSKSPRGAYMNYRDLDLGTNNNGVYTSYEQASKWGLPYFNKNFNRLIYVKGLVDPQNFFRHQQSIPSLSRGYAID